MTTKETKILELDLRLRELVEANTHKTRRNLELQEITEIPAPLWANWWAGRARPSSEMLMTICKKWPETTLWLLTGATDVLGGQISPTTSVEQQQKSTIRFLRQLTEIMDLKNPEIGYSLSEQEVDELNALSELRKKELERRLYTDITSKPSIYNQEFRDKQKIEILVEKLKKGWTFNDCMHAQYISLKIIAERAEPTLQALCVGITAFQKKISLKEAFIIEKNRLAENLNSTDEITALDNAKKLLGLENFANISDKN